MKVSITEERQFFLQSADPASGLAVAETYLGTSSIDLVASMIEADIGDFEIDKIHVLDKVAFCKIKRMFNVEFEVGGNDAYLCSWSPSDGLPYRLHAGRELILMRLGHKPLTVLSGRIPPNELFEEIPEYLFDHYVESGEFVKIEFCQPNKNKHSIYRGLRFVLYALRQEQWRMDAYILLLNVACKTGWNESLNWFEGSLLGYSEMENNAFAASVRSSPGQ